jgi:hypothetical protein
MYQASMQDTGILINIGLQPASFAEFGKLLIVFLVGQLRWHGTINPLYSIRGGNHSIPKCLGRQSSDFTNAHVSQPLSLAGDTSKGPFRKINDSVTIKGAPIVSSKDYRSTIVLVGHPDPCAEWHSAMGERHSPRVEAFTAGRKSAVKAWAVVRGGAARRFGLHGNRQSGKQCQRGGAKGDYSFLQW